MVVVRGAEFDKMSHKLVYTRKIDKIIAAITSRLYIILKKPHDLTLKIMPRKYIGLPHDGDSFNHDTSKECAYWLLHLRAMGYRVPQYAIDALLEEDEE